MATLLTGALPEVDHELMRRVGEGLEQLDDLEAALATAETVRDRVEQFLRSSYRSYARAAVADRGERLRAAVREHGKASEAKRAAEEALATVRADAAQLAEQLEAAKAELDAADGERLALLQSAEWASVAEIEQLGRAARHARATAEQVRERAADAGARVAGAEDDVRAAAATAEADRDALAETLEALAADARGADSSCATRRSWTGSRRPSPTCSVTRPRRSLPRSPSTSACSSGPRPRWSASSRRAASATLRTAACGGRRCIGRHRGDTRRRSRGPARGDRGLGRGARRAPARRGHDHPHARARGRRALARRANRRAGRPGRRARPPRERSWSGSRRSVRRSRTSGPQSPPSATRTRRARTPVPAGARSRARRSGGSVDFAPSLEPAARAGIEAALEGAGLLDAWVTPDGAVRRAETLDVLLDAGSPPVVGRSLAEALVAETDRVRRILAAVALVDGGASSPARACAVSADGRFRLGPAEGRLREEGARVHRRRRSRGPARPSSRRASTLRSRSSRPRRRRRGGVRHGGRSAGVLAEEAERFRASSRSPPRVESSRSHTTVNPRRARHCRA